MNKKNMKISMVSILSAMVLGACGNGDTEEEQNGNEDNGQQQGSSEQGTGVADASEPREPEEDEVCMYCNMNIPHDEDSVFTAQAVTEDGERVFFDGSGCLTNAKEEAGGSFEKEWVKDHSSNEWIEAETAHVVEDSELNSPMGYGYAFFEEEVDAEEYVLSDTAEAADWQSVEEDGIERAGGGEEMDHEGHGEEESGHDHEENGTHENH